MRVALFKFGRLFPEGDTFTKHEADNPYYAINGA